MSSPTSMHTDEDTSQYAQYRALSMSAVVTFVLGLISVVALAFPALLVIPLAGSLLGLFALRGVRKRASELTGQGLAVAGMALCAVCFFSGLSIATVVYITEVPEGYQRISYLDLQPDKNRPDLPVSPASLELNGRKVFVKGYIYPGDKRDNLTQFVLVPDMKACCFGGQPKLTDMIEVTLRPPLSANWAPIRRKLGGTLKVETRKKRISGLDGVYYQLDADYIR